MPERDKNGRFVKGNSGGPGNPFAARIGRLRSVLIDAVTEEDMRETIRAVVEAARGGDLAAAKLLFDRVLGPPVEADLIERIEGIEEALDHAKPAQCA